MPLAFTALILLLELVVREAQGYAIHKSCAEYSAQAPDAIKEAMEDISWLANAGKDHIEEDWGTMDDTKRSLWHKNRDEDQDDPSVLTEAEVGEIKGT
jgi:hypothetical protein